MSYHEITEKTYWYVSCGDCNYGASALDSQYEAIAKAREHIEIYVEGRGSINFQHTLEITSKLFVGRQP